VPGHILLVDDDEVFCEVVGQTLRRAGFEVTLAYHFAPVLNYLNSGQPLDLLLVDLVMPGSVNGIALSNMARLRRPGLKVLYLTGYDTVGIENHASGRILRKPIDDVVLISEIERTLAEASA
jgi:DNA-binding NtrC family response regulator